VDPAYGDRLSPPPGPDRSLAEHIAWLESIGQAPGCTCRWAWKSTGYRDGHVNIHSHGWVRMSTARGCPAHSGGRARRRDNDGD
jgi:hypothetical protein